MRWRALLLPLFVLLHGCKPEAPPPPGTWIVADVATLQRVLPRLERLTDTPAAVSARRAATVLTTCSSPTVYGTGADFTEALAELTCAAPPLSLAPWLDVRAGGLGVVRPVGAMGVLYGVLQASPRGELSGRLALYDTKDVGFSRILIPASDAPEEAVLSGTEALLHFRVKSRDGIDISSLSSGQGADLFGLDASLFSSAVLSGTWELGVWPGSTTEPMPPAALAVGLRSRAIGERAASEFLEALRQRWSVDAVARTWPFGSGGCLPTVHILPHLSPCYAFVGGSIVVAWNEVSLVRSQENKKAADGRNVLVVHPSAFPQTDALLQELRHPGTPAAVPMPWGHVEFIGVNTDGVFYDVRFFDGP